MPATISGTTGGLGLIGSGTAQNSTSGTALDFTGIPAAAKRITVLFNGVSTSGTSPVIVQAGTSGGMVTSGYVGSSTNQNAGGVAYGATTAGLGVDTPGAGSLVGTVTRVGILQLMNVTGNAWVATSILAYSNTAGVEYSASAITLSGTLDRLRVTTVNGTDTFDAGNVNILYE